MKDSSKYIGFRLLQRHINLLNELIELSIISDFTTHKNVFYVVKDITELNPNCYFFENELIKNIYTNINAYCSYEIPLSNKIILENFCNWLKFEYRLCTPLTYDEIIEGYSMPSFKIMIENQPLTNYPQISNFDGSFGNPYTFSK